MNWSEFKTKYKQEIRVGLIVMYNNNGLEHTQGYFKK